MSYVKAALMLRKESKCSICLTCGTRGHHISEVPGC